MLAGILNSYGTEAATGSISLIINMQRILAAVTHFRTLWRSQTVVMSEYLIRTCPEAPSSGRG